VRATLALVGSLVLMVVIGFGISMDVEDLKFAVLDRDQSTISQNYVNNLAGSRYFIEMPPIQDYADLDRRMKSGELALAIEIPPGFGRDVLRGSKVPWAPGSTAPCPSAARPSKAMSRPCTSCGWCSRRASDWACSWPARSAWKPAFATTPM
jgi:hypothetical protein